MVISLASFHQIPLLTNTDGGPQIHFSSIACGAQKSSVSSDAFLNINWCPCIPPKVLVCPCMASMMQVQVVVVCVPIQTAARLVIRFELRSILEVPFLVSAVVATTKEQVVVTRVAVETISSVFERHNSFLVIEFPILAFPWEPSHVDIAIPTRGFNTEAHFPRRQQWHRFFFLHRVWRDTIYQIYRICPGTSTKIAVLSITTGENTIATFPCAF